MVLKSPSATTSMFFFIAWCQGGDLQDHGSEGVQTRVQDDGFAKVGTMQVQVLSAPSPGDDFCGRTLRCIYAVKLYAAIPSGK